MSIEAIGSGIKTNLATITSLQRVYAPNELPESINEFPAAVVMHTGTNYGVTMGGACDRHDFTVKVFVTNQDQPSAFAKILDYTARTGSDSVVAAIRADTTLNSSASDVTVMTNAGQGVITRGGIQYLGTEWTLEVYECAS